MVGSVLGALLLVSSAFGSGVAPPTDCHQALLPAGVLKADRRPVDALDLARLRDFGRADQAIAGEAPFSVSPDGRSAALVLRRGDPASDAYCIGVVVVRLDGPPDPRLVDVGGDFIIDSSDVRGIPDLPLGTALPVTPRWSPDGRWLAYLRRDGGRTRAWRVNAAGGQAEPVGSTTDDALDVEWSPDGRDLMVTTRPIDPAGAQALAREEKRGYLYDGRFWTLSKAAPQPPRTALRIQRERVFPLGSPSEVSSPAPADRPAHAILFASGRSGSRAWTEPLDPKILVGSSILNVEVPGRPVPCGGAGCQNPAALWWLGDTLYWLSRPTPGNGGVTSLYRWSPTVAPRPTVVRSTIDILLGCQSAGGAIICAHEASTRPRTLSRVDPATGAITDFYDPNPEFAGLLKGAARRLVWTARDGIRTYGDLVLPPDHRDGQYHPLIIVLYQSRGFLRGGTGDEYPIQALAGRGFAVLSVERTPFIGEGRATSLSQLMRMSVHGFAERRRILRSIEAGVRRVIALGVVDPAQIGIAGVSDGAATVQFALINSTIFQAAAISSCCDEPGSSMAAADPGYGKLLIDAGFPPPGSDGRSFWKQYSLAANANRLRTPVLMQLPDDEFRLGLETFAALKQQHVPTELYVFNQEYHQKWRPAHRLASYTRALDWFDFWLNGRLAEAPDDPSRNARWIGLRKDQRR